METVARTLLPGEAATRLKLEWFWPEEIQRSPRRSEGWCRTCQRQPRGKTVCRIVTGHDHESNLAKHARVLTDNRSGLGFHNKAFCVARTSATFRCLQKFFTGAVWRCCTANPTNTKTCVARNGHMCLSFVPNTHRTVEKTIMKCSSRNFGHTRPGPPSRVDANPTASADPIKKCSSRCRTSQTERNQRHRPHGWSRHLLLSLKSSCDARDTY